MSAGTWLAVENRWLADMEKDSRPRTPSPPVDVSGGA